VSGRKVFVLTIASIVFFAIALLIKFTAPALLLVPILLLLGKERRGSKRNPRLTLLVTAAALILIVTFAIVSAPVLKYYGKIGMSYIQEGDHIAMVTNLFALAVPSQLLPSFYGAFATPPLANDLHPNFFVTTRDVVVTAVGILISAVVVIGMISRRRELAPEIAYVIAPLPILLPIVSSTARYLMTYQPFVWLFFLAGMAMLARPLVSRVGERRAAVVGAGAMAVLLATALVLRVSRVSGNFSRGQPVVSARAATGYIRDVSSTFREARVFLERLPREQTLLVSPAVPGRWTAILGLPYYAPDKNLEEVAKTQTLYLITECGTQEPCQDFSAWDSSQRAQVERFGQFRFVPVFDRERRYSKVRVYRIERL
jgi:hypothetical protein